MTFSRITDSTEVLTRTIDVLSERRDYEAHHPEHVTILSAADELTFHVHLSDPRTTIRVTTLPVYHDTLRGGRLRRWIARRWFIDKTLATSRRPGETPEKPRRPT